MTTLSHLNQHYAIPGLLSFREISPENVLIDIDNNFATASISLNGGHLLNWQPKNQSQPVIWLSEQAVIQPGKSIRGGVPVCWPWFGAHATETSFPSHGYARTSAWQVTETAALANGETAIELSLMEHNETERYWPHATPLSLRITVGNTLKMVLTTRNDSSENITLSEALHTYFYISDIGNIQVSGLDGQDYLDKVENFARQQQQGDIHFSGETDRVYVNSTSECIIHDPAFERNIHINKSASASTIVWTPWTDKAQAMGDLGENDGWRNMVCVESGNALENSVTLPPGETHTLSVEYSLTEPA